MAIQFITPEPKDSVDIINCDVGSADVASNPTLPGKESIPTAVMTLATFDGIVNSWAPLEPSDPFPPKTILARIRYPVLAKSDILNSWAAWNDVTTNDPLGARLSDLDSKSSYAPNWLAEMFNSPTSPLPILTAEATMKSTTPDGTRYASYAGFSGAQPLLRRDWLDGGRMI